MKNHKQTKNKKKPYTTQNSKQQAAQKKNRISNKKQISKINHEKNTNFVAQVDDLADLAEDLA